MYRNTRIEIKFSIFALSCTLGHLYCKILYSITSRARKDQQKYSFFNNEISREWRIKVNFAFGNEWNMKRWSPKATGVSFLSSAPERFYHRIRHTLAASVIFHLRRDIGQNAYHSNAINRFRSEFELLLNRIMIVFIEWLVSFILVFCFLPFNEFASVIIEEYDNY